MSAKVRSGISENGDQETRREKTIRDKEEEIRDKNVESMFIYDKDGNLLYSEDGDDSNVGTQEMDESLFNDAYVTHNHPDFVEDDGYTYAGGTFSKDDLNTFLGLNIYELRAVDTKTTYTLRKMAGKAQDSEGFMNAYKTALRIARDDANSHALKIAISRGDNEWTEGYEDKYARFAAQERHRIMDKWFRNNAKKYGYEYSTRSR